MNLSGVDLSADLIETNLASANLSGAKLTGMLLHTDLTNANLVSCPFMVHLCGTHNSMVPIKGT